MLIDVYRMKEASYVSDIHVKIYSYPSSMDKAETLRMLIEKVVEKHISGDMPDEFYDPEY